LKGEGILEHLGMAATQIDQFTQALFGKAESVIIVCAILTVVVGIPLYWLRLKAERGLIRVIRSSRNKRQTEKSAINTNSSETVSALSRLQCVDGKEACAPRCECGFELLGLQQLSEVPSTRATDYSSIAPLIFRRCSGGEEKAKRMN